MAQASKRLRRARRVKRDLTLAMRMLELAVAERDYARDVAVELEKALRAQVDEAKAEPKQTEFTITPISDEEPPSGQVTEGIDQ